MFMYFKTISHGPYSLCIHSIYIMIVATHKTQVSPCDIKSDLKHHKGDLCVNPKRFCEVDQQARLSTGVGLAKNGPKSEFQSYLDPNPGLTGSNPISTPNPDPNPVLTPNLDPNSILNPNPIILSRSFSQSGSGLNPELFKLPDFTTHKGV